MRMLSAHLVVLALGAALAGPETMGYAGQRGCDIKAPSGSAFASGMGCGDLGLA